MTFFFKVSLGPFEVVEVEWRSMLNFEAATSKFCNCSSKFCSSPRKAKVDLCMTNGSNVLIYLTLISFFLYYILARVSLWGTIKKTNKSELWNRLSYRGLPYFFEVGSQTFKWLQNFEVAASKFNIDHPLTSIVSKMAQKSSAVRVVMAAMK